MTLPAALQLGRLQLAMDSRYAAPAAVDRYLLAAPMLQHTADADRRDRQTDGRTDTQPLHRPCTAYYAGSVNRQILASVF